MDPEIFADVKGRLGRQHAEALNWRDACVMYSNTFKIANSCPNCAPNTHSCGDERNS